MRRLLFLSFLLLAVISGCEKSESLKIGFLGSITGKNSDLGVAGRDALLFAVEELNSNGGINGRKVEVIVKDDAQTPERAAKAVEDLAREGVAAIVGPMGSTMAKAALPTANKLKTVLVSPTSSSNELSTQDDYFFRVMEPNLLFARHLAETCLKLKIRKVAAIYDLQNKAYTSDIFIAFRDEFTRLGGEVKTVLTYDSADSPSFMPLVRNLGLNSVDGVMMLGNSIDSINIGQQVRKEHRSIPILSGACGIAQRDLLQQAGKSIDGIIFTLPVNNLCPLQSYLGFKTSFQHRFNYQPTFAAMLSYDAAQVVFAGLKKNSDRHRFKETLQGIKSFPGLQGEILLDRYGDPDRKLFIIRYANGVEELIE